MMEGLFLLVPLGLGVGVCIGLILGERHSRIYVQDEMRVERELLKDTLKTISETHNSLVTTQTMQQNSIYDLEQKVSFLVQGVK